MTNSARLSRILPAFLALAALAWGLASADDDSDVQIQTAAIVQSATGDTVYAAINAAYQAVRPIFEKNCFDCHSRYTDYPWYHSLPLVGGMMDNHIEEGREQLDLSDDFPFGGFENQARGLRAVKNEIEEGDMPLWSYRLLHWSSGVTGARRDSVFAWIDQSLRLLGETSESDQK